LSLKHTGPRAHVARRDLTITLSVESHGCPESILAALYVGGHGLLRGACCME
jgi:hypothetical protein